MHKLFSFDYWVKYFRHFFVRFTYGSLQKNRVDTDLRARPNTDTAKRVLNGFGKVTF